MDESQPDRGRNSTVRRSSRLREETRSSRPFLYGNVAMGACLDCPSNRVVVDASPPGDGSANCWRPFIAHARRPARASHAVPRPHALSAFFQRSRRLFAIRETFCCAKRTYQKHSIRYHAAFRLNSCVSLPLGETAGRREMPLLEGAQPTISLCSQSMSSAPDFHQIPNLQPPSLISNGFYVVKLRSHRGCDLPSPSLPESESSLEPSIDNGGWGWSIGRFYPHQCQSCVGLPISAIHTSLLCKHPSLLSTPLISTSPQFCVLR